MIDCCCDHTTEEQVNGIWYHVCDDCNMCYDEGWNEMGYWENLILYKPNPTNKTEGGEDEPQT